MNPRNNAITGLLGAGLFVLSTIIGGLQFDHYSHVSQFISESYATGTPNGMLLRFLGYLPSGILLAWFCFSAVSHLPKSRLVKAGLIGLGVFYGMGTAVVSIFPCDAGCNKEFIDPSISQVIHNATGSLTYLFVPLSLLAIGYGLRNKSTSLSVVAFGASAISILFVVIFSSDPSSHYAGMYQRIIEGSILIFIAVIAITILNTKKLQPA